MSTLAFPVGFLLIPAQRLARCPWMPPAAGTVCQSNRVQGPHTDKSCAIFPARISAFFQSGSIAFSNSLQALLLLCVIYYEAETEIQIFRMHSIQITSRCKLGYSPHRLHHTATPTPRFVPPWSHILSTFPSLPRMQGEFSITPLSLVGEIRFSRLLSSPSRRPAVVRRT